MREYRNVFAEVGIPEADIAKKLESAFNTMFYGSDDERVYHPVGDDMGYIEDTGNIDARTEGMSYGMMLCVQLGKKEEFDRIWKWSMTYMYMTEGRHAGYFAWSCKPDGTKNSHGPAPDGEEYFAAALLMASSRWGDGDGLYNYSEWARTILRDCIHRGGEGEKAGLTMWEPSNHLIKFVPESPYTDASYHLPHFYEIFAERSDPEDRAFWAEAAKASREYLHKACHPKTGLCSDYANYDGSVLEHSFNPHAGLHYSDSYRTVYNIALDWSWNKADPWQPEECRRVQKFFEEAGDKRDLVPHPDGTFTDETAMHPVAIRATEAAASLAALDGANAEEKARAERLVKEFFEMPLRTGKRRYYDNFLHIFSLLMLSGSYRIY